MATGTEDKYGRSTDTFLKKGIRKVLPMGVGESAGYTKVMLPFSEDEISRARTNDRIGSYDSVSKTHAPRSNTTHLRVGGTFLNVANGNLTTKNAMVA